MRRASLGFRRAVTARPVRRRQIALSLGTALANVSAFAACSAAIGAPLPPVISTTLIPLVLFAMVLPLSIGGWGLREGAAALLYPVAGASAGAGLAASVAFGLMIWVSVLPGVWLGWRGQKNADHGP